MFILLGSFVLKKIKVFKQLPAIGLKVSDGSNDCTKNDFIKKISMRENIYLFICMSEFAKVFFFFCEFFK